MAAVGRFVPQRSSFFHSPSGYEFVVNVENNANPPLTISFSKHKSSPDHSISPKWFIGSGNVGSSFVFERDGYFFMSPVSYYSSESRWDVSPGYESYTNLYLTRAVTPECWSCHASGTRSIAGTVNRYDDPPFEEAGIGCERCHGPGAVHAKSGGHAPITNPSKLSGRAREDVCAQCHLTGQIRILRPGRNPGDFQPGEDLAKYVSIFVDPDARHAPQATGHFEALASSACRIKSGGRLSCGSCHSVHSRPSQSNKPAYYRAKCLGCHATDDCQMAASARVAAGDLCASCHMPKQAVADVLHAAYTDHRIAAKPTNAEHATLPGKPVAFGPAAPSRDLALAEAAVSFARNDFSLAREAFATLRRLEPSLNADAPALAVLGRFYDLRGDRQKARDLYRKSATLDPSQVEAAVNLGAILFQEGNATEALIWWRKALTAQPGLEAARLNIARLLVRGRQVEAARKELQTLLEFSPGHPTAIEQLNMLR